MKKIFTLILLIIILISSCENSESQNITIEKDGKRIIRPNPICNELQNSAVGLQSQNSNILQGANKISQGDNGEILVNDEPYFPLGIYYFAGKTNDPDLEMTYLKDSKLNLIYAYRYLDPIFYVNEEDKKETTYSNTREALDLVQHIQKSDPKRRIFAFSGDKGDTFELMNNNENCNDYLKRIKIPLEEIIDHPNLLMWYSDEPRYDHSKINERIHFNKLSESEQNRHNYHKCLSQKTNIPTMIIYSRDGHMKDNIDFVKKHQKTNEDTNTIFFGGDTYLTVLLDDDDKTLKYYLELAEDVYTYSHFMSKKELCPAKFNM